MHLQCDSKTKYFAVLSEAVRMFTPATGTLDRYWIFADIFQRNRGICLHPDFTNDFTGVVMKKYFAAHRQTEDRPLAKSESRSRCCVIE